MRGAARALGPAFVLLLGAFPQIGRGQEAPSEDRVVGSVFAASGTGGERTGGSVGWLRAGARAGSLVGLEGAAGPGASWLGISGLHYRRLGRELTLTGETLLGSGSFDAGGALVYRLRAAANFQAVEHRVWLNGEVHRLGLGDSRNTTATVGVTGRVSPRLLLGGTIGTPLSGESSGVFGMIRGDWIDGTWRAFVGGVAGRIRPELQTGVESRVDAAHEIFVGSTIPGASSVTGAVSVLWLTDVTRVTLTVAASRVLP